MRHPSWILGHGLMIVFVVACADPAHAQMGGKKKGFGSQGGMGMQKGFGQQGGMGGMCGKGQGGGGGSSQNAFMLQGGFPNPFLQQGGQNPFLQQGNMPNPFMQMGAGFPNPFMQQGGMQNPFIQQAGGFQNPLMQNNAMQNPLGQLNQAQLQMLAQLLQNANAGMQNQQPFNAGVQPDAATVQAVVQMLQSQGFQLQAPVQRQRPQRNQAVRDADE